MNSDFSFQTLDHGSQDLVLAVHYNLYGTRLVTASSDHHLRVWDKKDALWILTDSWVAHDSEITDVRWNGPYVGQHIASIGEDGVMKLWQEDPLQAPLSGRRFKAVMNPPLASKSKLAWMSLDFKNIGAETYLALVTRDGNLSIMEPRNHDDLASDWVDWMENEDFFVCGTPPPRSEEASFRVAWHQEKIPCWTAVNAGLDRKALSLAVACMNTVKVYRTDKDRRLYLAAELTGSQDIVRGIAWSNGSMRGFDIIATAGKDGAVRVYELRTPEKRNNDDGQMSRSGSTNGNQSLSQRPAAVNQPSGIGAGLAGISRGTKALADDAPDVSRVKQTVRLAAELREHKGAVWRVGFSFTGDLLTSTGDDGAIRTYKRSLDGTWHEFAEIDLNDTQ